MQAVEQALERALLVSPVTAADGATVELARKYARDLDADVDALPKLGPRLLEVLVQLGMTPKARAGVIAPTVVAGDPIDELRSRRERRG